MGEWGEGFFAMTYVGALNVGAIELHYDQDLKTNTANPDYFDDKLYQNKDAFVVRPGYMNDLESVKGEYCIKEDLRDPMPFEFEAGEEMGMFKFGSTIVLMMEIPRNMNLELTEGQKLLYGENIIGLS